MFFLFAVGLRRSKEVISKRESTYCLSIDDSINPWSPYMVIFGLRWSRLKPFSKELMNTRVKIPLKTMRIALIICFNNNINIHYNYIFILHITKIRAADAKVIKIFQIIIFRFIRFYTFHKFPHVPLDGAVLVKPIMHF